jgi:hypothetical protein
VSCKADHQGTYLWADRCGSGDVRGTKFCDSADKIIGENGERDELVGT